MVCTKLEIWLSDLCATALVYLLTVQGIALSGHKQLTKDLHDSSDPTGFFAESGYVPRTLCGKTEDTQLDFGFAQLVSFSSQKLLMLGNSVSA